MKKRLDSKLRELINDSPADAHLLKQQVLLQNAVISTINSFCFELIRDNITDQGITSGFGILDDSDNAVMKSRALEELINYYSENDYESISYLYDKFCIKNEKGLTDAIARADNFLASVAFRDEWLDKAVAEYEKPFMESVYYSDLLGSVRRKLEKAQAAADSCCDLIGEIFPDIKSSAAQKSLAQAEEDLSAVDSVLAVIKSGRLPSVEEASAVTFKDLVRIGKAEHNKPLRELYKKKRDKVKKLTYAALSDLGSVESDYAESAKVTRILAPMLKKYAEILWAAKCEKNAISFDDGERLALELLADRDENGNIVWEANFISGKPGEDATPEGVWQINSNNGASKLIGAKDPETGKPKYESPVSYWMPFEGNMVGFHDATWQNDSSFDNAESYKWCGSHGCINLRLADAKALHDCIKVGLCVVVHS